MGPARTQGPSRDERIMIDTRLNKILEEVYIGHTASKLMCAYDLNSRYDYWNAKVFDGQLPRVQLRWATLKSVTGKIVAQMNRQTGEITIRHITISDTYKRSDEKLDSVLLHEMCHAYVLSVLKRNDNHGFYFMDIRDKAMAKSGVKITITDLVTDEISEDVDVPEFVVLMLDKDNGRIWMQMIAMRSWTSNPSIWEQLTGAYENHEIVAVASTDKKLYFSHTLQKKYSSRWYIINKQRMEDYIRGGRVINRHEPKEMSKAASVRTEQIALRVANTIIASSAEKEVERLLKFLLKGTPFQNKAFAVGGYVRDEVLGLEAKDLDIVVEIQGGAEKLTKFIHSVFSTDISTPRQMGAAYPIWEITFKDDVIFDGETYKTAGAVIQFADTQKEMFPDDSSRQRTVEYGTLGEDVERRDFTVNMLMKDLSSGELKDLTGVSIQDIKDGVLRGHPAVNFDKILSDDPLRMIRLVRFQVKYGWAVPMSVLKAVKRNAARINIVSAERIRDELIKIMNLGKLAQAVKMMKAIGLLQHILPEVQTLGETEHEMKNGHHQEGDVLKHTLLVLQNAKPGVESQLAALLHDIGKPASQEVVEGTIRFIGHEKVGGEITEAIMRRLKFDNDVVGKVRTMVESHMRPHHLTRDDEVGPKALRKFIQDVGEELVEAILDLAEADSLGTLPAQNVIPGLRERIEEVKKPAAQAEKLPLDGNDIQRLLGVKPGREVGMALKFLKDENYEWALAGKVMTKADAEKLILEKFRPEPV